MATRRSRIAARLRRGLGMRRERTVVGESPPAEGARMTGAEPDRGEGAEAARGAAPDQGEGAEAARGAAPDQGAEPDRAAAAGAAPARPPSPLAALRGLGERPAGGSAQPADQAAEAELDTLRGELVRELDRMAADDDGSGSFRRIAS
ncbi:MAG: hypothetical protein QOJ57_1627 [Thermoleophilaceae bacterium]|nr:hypothetical protein [Thermoleophilaceae bacterium]